jgi:hypothetical protein
LLSFDRFRPLWYIVPRKIWQPCANLTTSTWMITSLAVPSLATSRPAKF